MTSPSWRPLVRAYLRFYEVSDDAAGTEALCRALLGMNDLLSTDRVGGQRSQWLCYELATD